MNYQWLWAGLDTSVGCVPADTPGLDNTPYIFYDEYCCVNTTLPYRQRHERFSRLFAFNKWFMSMCHKQKLLFVNNWDVFWEWPRLFHPDGLHPSRIGADLPSDIISKILRTIWLVSPILKNTDLIDKSTCVFPQIVRSNNKLPVKSKNKSDYHQSTKKIKQS